MPTTSTHHPKSRRSRLAIALVLGLLTLVALLPSLAQAGVMVQRVCVDGQGQATSTSGWSQTDGGGWRGGTSLGSVSTCSGGTGAIGMTLGNDRLTNVTHRLNWTYTAPPGTRIDAYSLMERYRIDWPLSGNYGNVYTFRSWHDAWALANFFETPLPDYGAVNDSGWHTLAGTGVDYGSLSFQLECADIGNPTGGDCMQGTSYWSLTGGTISLRDTSAPAVSAVSGSLTRDGEKTGTVAIAFNASDTGVGVYRTVYRVDGQVVSTQILDDNTGRCAPRGSTYTFGWAVPCKLALSATSTFDTATLLDGQHDVQVTVEDASGNAAIAWNDTITTRNAPALLDRPALSGTAKIGSQLTGSTGSWSRTPTAYAYQYLRCPAAVTGPAEADSCTPVLGATSAAYVPGIADVYGRMMLRVRASNANGTTEAFSAPSSIVLDAQGRASAPTPSDGGPRDVVIVPVAPGGSSTTIIGGSTSGPSYSIVGLRNPLADQAGHVPNGTNAAAGARVKIAFAARQNGRARQSQTVRSTRNRRWVVQGSVVNPAGRPIGGAVLVSAWQTPGGKWVAHTGVRTRADGRFTYILPKGPSREVRFVYFAFSDATAYNASNVIEEKVTAPVTLRVAPRAARNGDTVRFAGAVGTDAVPKSGVLVTLQARYPGGPWKQFTTARARGNGRFGASYRFTRTSSTTRYAFRALVAKQDGYPFEGGISRPIEVLVTP
jgi:hypothetical protein